VALTNRSSIHGALVIDKPVGPTSHDVVVCARRALGVSRIGHTGTLDPQAAGVLPLVVGQATRLAQHLTASDKEYLATIRFGITTDTYDAAGTVLDQRGGIPSPTDLQAALARFTGTFEQTPPVYSAKMVGGERSYARARAGAGISPDPVRVTAHTLELVAVEGPQARLRVRCSAGFYVRSLAHDLGQRLGTGAILDELIRTEAAGFRLDAALPFAWLVTAARDAVRAAIRPMESLLTDVPAVVLTPIGVEWARHGRAIPPRLVVGEAATGSLVRLLGGDGRLVGLGERTEAAALLQPAVIFKYN
jgi:tRNA pseudouridine55 synthase